MKILGIILNGLWGAMVSLLTYKDHIALWVAILTGFVMVLQSINIIRGWFKEKKS